MAIEDRKIAAIKIDFWLYFLFLDACWLKNVFLI